MCSSNWGFSLWLAGWLRALIAKKWNHHKNCTLSLWSIYINQLTLLSVNILISYPPIYVHFVIRKTDQWIKVWYMILKTQCTQFSLLKMIRLICFGFIWASQLFWQVKLAKKPEVKTVQGFFFFFFTFLNICRANAWSWPFSNVQANKSFWKIPNTFTLATWGATAHWQTPWGVFVPLEKLCS